MADEREGLLNGLHEIREHLGARARRIADIDQAITILAAPAQQEAGEHYIVGGEIEITLDGVSAVIRDVMRPESSEEP